MSLFKDSWSGNAKLLNHACCRMTRSIRCWKRRGVFYSRNAVRLVGTSVIGMLLWALPSATEAQVSWNNTSGGVFSVGSNWAGGVAPTSTQVAAFNLFSATDQIGVTFTNPAITNSLGIGQGNFTFNLGGQSYSLINPGDGLLMGSTGIGPGQTGSLTVIDGTLTFNRGRVGSSTSTINTNLNQTLSLGVGSQLIVEDSLIVGEQGAGTLFVGDGGRAQIREMILGDEAGAPGNLTIDGFDAIATIGGATLGRQGDSLTTIANGGTLNIEVGVITGSSSGSSGLVNVLGENSSLNLNGAFLVSGSGTTDIRVFEGSLNAHNSRLSLGPNASLLIADRGRLNLTGSDGIGLQVHGGGIFTVDRQGTVNISDPAGLQVFSGGTLRLDDGTINTTSLNLAGGTFNFVRGYMTVDGGTFNTTGGLAIGGSSASGDSVFTLAGGATSTGLTSLVVGSANNTRLREFQVLSASTLNTSALSTIGQLGSNSVVKISGVGSTWNASNSVTVGDGGEGQLLVEDGGRLNTNGNSLFTGVAGAGGVGNLVIQSGGRIDAGSIELARVSGAVSNALFTGGGTVVSASGLFVGGSSSGEGGAANLAVADGSEVNISGTLRARNQGNITIDGGRITTQNYIRNATGSLNFQDGELRVVGSYSNSSGDVQLIGSDINDNPTLTLAGAASTSGITNLSVGSSTRQGTLNVQTNAQLTTGALSIGNLGTVNLDGGRLLVNSLSGSGTFHWLEGDVNFQSSTTLDSASLTRLLGSSHNLGDGRTLGSIGGTMTLASSLNVTGGLLTPTNLTNDSTLTVNQGQLLTGALTNNSGRLLLIGGNSQVTASSVIQNNGSLRMSSPTASMSGGQLVNNAGGTVSGTGQIENELFNSGIVRVSAGEHLVFSNSGNTNLASINLSGGLLEFSQDLTNRSGAAITGRGTLVTSSLLPGESGLLNDGLMSFSAGTTDIYGDVEILSEGRVVTSGNAVTTFFDDVIHNGSEIRTFLGSTTVFLGDQSGAGSFTGPGVVEYAGDLRPGNSPASIHYEGDVFFNSSVKTFIELGGLADDQFDQLLIDGDFNVDGSLFVSLINGFQLAAGDSFLIGDVGGSLTGKFIGLTEGSVVGSFSGHDLFITYAGGNGNDVALFTAVPEPSSAILSLLLTTIAGFQRRKRQ